MQEVLLKITTKVQQSLQSLTKLQNSVGKLQSNVQKMQVQWRDGMHKIKGRLKTLPKNIEEIEAELERLRQKQRQSFSPKYIMTYEKEIRKLEKELRKIERKKQGGFMPYIGNKLKDGFSGVFTAGASYLGISSLGNIISGTVRLASQMEQTRQSFSVMLKDAGAADLLINEMNKFANRTPFTNTQIYKTAKLLKSFGIETKNIIPYMQMLGDASGGDAERFESLSYAFAQVQSAGKLTGQDLQQFITAGFNPLQVLSEKYKVPISKLKELMSKGKITSQMLVEAFQYATEEGGQFYNMMERQSNTLAGRWSTLVGKIQLLAIKLGNMLLPIIKKVVNIGIKIIDYLSAHQRLFKILAVGIGVLVGLMAAWVPIQWALNFALTANPIGVIIMGVAILIGFIALVIVKIQGVIAVWKRLRLQILAVLGALSFVFGPAVMMIGAIMEAVLQLFKAINYVIKYGFKSGLTLWAQEFLNSFITAINKLITWANKVFRTKWKPIKVISWVDKSELEAQRKANKKTGSVLDKLKDISKITVKSGVNINGNNKNKDNALTQQLQPGIEAITSGGRKNIIVNIQDFTGVKELNAYGIEETISSLEDKVTAAVLRIMNSANEIA